MFSGCPCVHAWIMHVLCAGNSSTGLPLTSNLSFISSSAKCCVCLQLISPNNVATYGTLCALATFDRQEIQRHLLNSRSVAQWLTATQMMHCPAGLCSSSTQAAGQHEVGRLQGPSHGCSYWGREIAVLLQLRCHVTPTNSTIAKIQKFF